MTIRPAKRLRQSDAFSQQAFHPPPRLLKVSGPLRGRKCFRGGDVLGTPAVVLDEKKTSPRRWALIFTSPDQCVYIQLTAVKTLCSSPPVSGR